MSYCGLMALGLSLRQRRKGMYTREDIANMADDYASVYITNHTNIPMDSPKYRALVDAFTGMAREVMEHIGRNILDVFDKQA